jgi:purine-binding chemotaxis protein CheW
VSHAASGLTLLDRLRACLDKGGTVDVAAGHQAVLEARARRLAQPRALSAADDAEPGLEVLCFAIASERYAVALSALSEVMVLGAWTPVPGQPQYLLGVTNLRGEIRPLLDLHALLGLDQPPETERAWVLFVDHQGAEVGLRVERLEQVVSLDTATLTNPQVSGNGLPQRFVAGIDAQSLILLDVNQILALDVLNDARASARRLP